MARSYRPVDREQEFLLAPSMLDWLPDDHLVWLVIAAVERLDTARFHESTRRGGVGRQGYDPDMLLTLFVYAMAHGVCSSRRIEQLCQTDVAFRIICAGDVPDHTVLARFRQHHQDAMTDLLTQTLLVAAELGLVSLGVVAFDGTRIAGNASKDLNRDEAHLRRLAEEYLATVREADTAEDVLFGEHARGDRLATPVADRTGRRERIGAAVEQVTARRRQVEQDQRQRAERAEQVARRRAEQAEQATQRAATYHAGVAEPGRAPCGRPPIGVDPVAVAKARWERIRTRAQSRHAAAPQRRPAPAPGHKPVGRRPVPVDEQPKVRRAYAAYQAAQAAAPAAGDVPDRGDHGGAAGGHGTGHGEGGRDGAAGVVAPRANLTDPDSRLLKTRNGWIQGYNCQTAISDDEFIVSARVTQDTNDCAQFVPIVADLTTTAAQLTERTGRADLRVGTLLGDAGYDTNANLIAEGPDRLIADSSRHVLDQRAAAEPATGEPPPDTSARQAMNHRLRTLEGHALYQRRAAMIEPSNAWIKDGRGLRRFSRRGLAAVQAELSLACAVTNLLKLATKGITAAQLRAR